MLAFGQYTVSGIFSIQFFDEIIDHVVTLQQPNFIAFKVEIAMPIVLSDTE